MPANDTSGTRPRSKRSNPAPAVRALDISMARSPRKLKKITPSPSSMAATGPPSGFRTVNAGSTWSLMPGSCARKCSTAAAALGNPAASPRTWALQPRATMLQSASYRSMVTTIRPPPEAMR